MLYTVVLKLGVRTPLERLNFMGVMKQWVPLFWNLALDAAILEQDVQAAAHTFPCISLNEQNGTYFQIDMEKLWHQ